MAGAWRRFRAPHRNQVRSPRLRHKTPTESFAHATHGAGARAAGVRGAPWATQHTAPVVAPLPRAAGRTSDRAPHRERWRRGLAPNNQRSQSARAAHPCARMRDCRPLKPLRHFVWGRLRERSAARFPPLDPLRLWQKKHTITNEQTCTHADTQTRTNVHFPKIPAPRHESTAQRNRGLSAPFGGRSVLKSHRSATAPRASEKTVEGVSPLLLPKGVRRCVTPSHPPAACCRRRGACARRWHPLSAWCAHLPGGPGGKATQH